MIFNGKVFNFEQIIDTFKFHLALWFKAKWSDSHYMILDIIRFSKDIHVQKVSKATKRTIVKESPSDYLKFNVDGSAKGKLGPASIDGVLRGCNAAVKVVFPSL